MSHFQRKNRLSKMRLDFVSLVPAGDDPEAAVVISKAAPENPNDEREHMDPEIKKDDLAPEVVAYIEALETEVDDLSKSNEELNEQIEKAAAEGLVVKSEEDQRKELLAKADPAVRALIEKAEKDAEQAAQIAKAERDARLDREFISKAETLPMINTDKTMLGGLLRRISEALTAEDSAEVEKMLRAANAQIEKGNLFATHGLGGGDTVVSKSVEAKAQEFMKADPSLTFDQAQAKVYESDPALFEQAMTEGKN